MQVTKFRKTGFDGIKSAWIYLHSNVSLESPPTQPIRCHFINVSDMLVLNWVFTGNHVQSPKPQIIVVLHVLQQ